jgi:hypothetical protein
MTRQPPCAPARACAPLPLLSRLRSGRRFSGSCGRLRAGRLGHRQALRLLAEIGEACGPDTFEIAAIGRMGEIEIEDLLPWTAGARSGWRGPPAAVLADSERPSRGSISRATCIDSVEAPETMRPLVTSCQAARRSPRGRRRHARRNAVLIGDQHAQELRIDVFQPSSSAASGPPASQRRAAAVPSASSTSAETVRPCRAAAERRGRPPQAEHEPRGRQVRSQQCDRKFPPSLMAAPPRPPSCPVAVRAENCGRYMSSTLAAG